MVAPVGTAFPASRSVNVPPSASGNQALINGDAITAEKKYRDGLASNPPLFPRIDLTNGLVESLIWQLRYDEAETLAQKAVELEGQAKPAPEALVCRTKMLQAQIAEGKGQFAEAETYAKQSCATVNQVTVAVHSQFLARIYDSEGKTALAEETRKHALEIVLNNKSYLLAVEFAYELSALCSIAGRQAEAAAYAKQAQEIWTAQKLTGPGVLLSLMRVGRSYYVRCNYKVAAAIGERGILLAEQVYGPTSPSICETLGSTAVAYSHNGDTKKAEAIYERALGLEQPQIKDTKSPWFTHARDLIHCYAADGKYEQMNDVGKLLIKNVEQVAGKDPAFSQGAKAELALNYAKTKQFSLVPDVVKEVLDKGVPSFGPQFLVDIGRVYKDADRLKDAESYFTQAAELQEHQTGKNSLAYWDKEYSLGNLLYKEGRHTEAQRVLEDGLAAVSKIAPKSPLLVDYQLELINLYRQIGRFEDADEIQRQAKGNEQTAINTGSPDALWYAGDREDAIGKFAKAEGFYRQALALLEKKHADTSEILMTLGVECAKQKKFAESVEFYKKTLTQAQKDPVKNAGSIQSTRRSLAYTYFEEGKFEEAEELLMSDLSKSKEHWDFVRHRANIVHELARPTISHIIGTALDNCPAGNSPPHMSAKQKSLAHAIDLFLNSKRKEAGAELQTFYDAAGKTAPTLEKAQAAFVLSWINAKEGDTKKAREICAQLQKDVKSSPPPLAAAMSAYLEAASLNICYFDPNFRIVSAMSTACEARKKVYGETAPETNDCKLQIAIEFERLGIACGQWEKDINESWLPIIYYIYYTDINSPATVKDTTAKQRAVAMAFQNRMGGVGDALRYFIDRSLCLAKLLAANGKRSDALKEAAADMQVIAGAAEDPDDKVEAAVQVAHFFRDVGDYMQAKLVLTEFAAPMVEREKLPEKNCVVCLSLAKTALAEGDYQEAIGQAEKAITVAHQFPDNLKGRMVEALEVATQAEAALADVRGPDNSQSELSKSLDYADQCLKLIDIPTGQTSHHLAVILLQKGLLQGTLKDYTTSQKTLERALSITEHSDQPQCQELRADAHSALGSLYMAMGKYDEANKQFSAAVDLNNLDPTASGRIKLCHSLNGLAEIAARNGQMSVAENHVLRSSAAIGDYIKGAFPSLPFGEQCRLAAKANEQINYLLAYCHSQSVLPQAYDYIMQWKGLLINTLRQQSIDSGLSNVSPRMTDLRTARQKLAEAVAKPGTTKAQIEALEREVSHREALVNMGLMETDYYDPAADVGVDWLVGDLKPDEVFIDVNRYAQPDKPGKISTAPLSCAPNKIWNSFPSAMPPRLTMAFNPGSLPSTFTSTRPCLPAHQTMKQNSAGGVTSASPATTQRSPSGETKHH